MSYREHWVGGYSGIITASQSVLCRDPSAAWVYSGPEWFTLSLMLKKVERMCPALGDRSSIDFWLKLYKNCRQPRRPRGSLRSLRESWWQRARHVERERQSPRKVNTHLTYSMSFTKSVIDWYALILCDCLCSFLGGSFPGFKITISIKNWGKFLN